MQFQKLQQTIGHTFKNPDLLQEAVTHPSLAHERAGNGTQHNQRLEFLGDAVLQLVLTDFIYALYPDFAEGKLTQVRAHEGDSFGQERLVALLEGRQADRRDSPIFGCPLTDPEEVRK